MSGFIRNHKDVRLSGTTKPVRRWWHGIVIPWLERQGKCGCRPGSADEKTPLYRWLGVLWYGWPWPLRIEWNRDVAWFNIKTMLGCGCQKDLKDLWKGFVLWRGPELGMA